MEAIETAFAMVESPGKGRGLFCARALPRGSLIHTAPGLLFPSSDYTNYARHTVLEHYLYNLKNGDRLLALGYGSIFNHCRTPNVDYRIDREKLEIKYYAARDIAVGEELCIYYGANLWFDDSDGGAGEDSKVADEGGSSFLALIDL